jgi:D-alanyl-D-alanine endopeptidase (penicillin-binding protein 7)
MVGIGCEVGLLRQVATALAAVVAAAALWTPAGAATPGTERSAQIESKPAPARASKKVRAQRRAAQRPSVAQLAGLGNEDDELALRSRVALVVDQDTDEVLFSKNSDAVLPIASITKLMTALVVTEANLPLDEPLTISADDVDLGSTARSRLRVGTQLTREQMLHLALMASENRAAHALGRSYPGGEMAFVIAMNNKARELGMLDTHFVEPTGLSSDNRSSARDLATLVRAAHEHRIIRELSTSTEQRVEVGRRLVQYHNTNRLVNHSSWEIGLQKTGYISAAGRCLVMQAKLAGRKLIMVFLDSTGKYTRIGDAERVRRWVEETLPAPATTLRPTASARPSAG